MLTRGNPQCIFLYPLARTKNVTTCGISFLFLPLFFFVEAFETTFVLDINIVVLLRHFRD